MSAMDWLLLVTAVLTGLMAGLFYAWSCSVMPGFARLADREFVAAMRAANRAILNPVFFAAFFGAPLALIAATAINYGAGARFALLLAATIVYLAGNFAVTSIGNVPLNNRLDAFEPASATDAEVAAARRNFERRWGLLNHVRAVASTIALALVVAACLITDNR